MCKYYYEQIKICMYKKYEVIKFKLKTISVKTNLIMIEVLFKYFYVCEIFSSSN